ncbi:anti-sigma factor [Nocardia sp. NPDC049220]|uniref:anti-sigma factor n=1 Tax=Nocardia sp. NPDC049220 TaxID=3155273 RepID=UPI0033CB952C
MVDTPPRSDTDLLDLAYPCALDAVADIERRHIDARLASADPAVRREFSDTVWQMREVMGRLAVLDELAPPPGLESRILAALPDTGTAAVTCIPHPSSLRRLRWAVPMAAITCLIFGGSVVAERIADHPPIPSVVEQIHGQRDVRTVLEPVSGGGSLVVEASLRLGRAVVAFDGVAPPPTDRVYQVWLVPAAGQPRSAGVLADLPSSDRPFVTPYRSGELLAVSVEPPGGSDTPSTEPIVGVALP